MSERERVVRRFAVLLAFALSGCIALSREHYTTPVGATPISPSDTVPISREHSGHGFAQSPTAAETASDVLVSVCDWDPGFWMIVFPPLPIPMFSNEETPGIPGTTVVRVTFEAKGPWKARFADIAIVGTDGARVSPMRYRVVLPEKAESLAGQELPIRDLEPCSRSVEPHKSVKTAKIAVLESGELLLTFDTNALPKKGRKLELGGITRNDVAVPMPALQLDKGSRWYWYRFFP
jgi:hypothetical protein